MVKQVEVGQIVYVNKKFSFGSNKPNLRPEKVVRVNSNSFYTINESESKDTLTRFSRKNWKNENSDLTLTAYETTSEYWQGVNTDAEKESNILIITQRLQYVENDTLKAILDYLNEI